MGYPREAKKDNKLYCHEKDSEEITTSHNFIIMLTRSSNIKIIYSVDIQKVLDNHSKVFETPKGLPPIPDHDHAIHLILGSVPPNIRPYRYPYVQQSEIECMIAEMLEASIIQPSQSSFFT